MVVAACGAGRDVTEVVDASGSDGPALKDGRIPYTPKADGTSGAGGASDGGLDSAATHDAPNDGVAAGGATGDAASDVGPGDALTCPATSSCNKNTLTYYVPGKFFCSLKSTVCEFGCRQVGHVAECAPSWDPGPCSQAGMTTCLYKYSDLCFGDAASACACAGCGTSQCDLVPVYAPKKGRLKLPFKLPNNGAAPSPTPPPPDAALPDAGPAYWSASCSP